MHDPQEEGKHLPPQKCEHKKCKRRLKFVDFATGCKCGKIFCPKHKLPFQHNCTFDHIKAYTNNLQKDLVKLDKTKITHI